MDNFAVGVLFCDVKHNLFEFLGLWYRDGSDVTWFPFGPTKMVGVFMSCNETFLSC
jgi:hypothetical protein